MSAHDATYWSEVVQFGETGNIGNSDSNEILLIAKNIYYNGTNWIYEQDGFGCVFGPNSSNGSINFYTTPTGLTGNTATISQQLAITQIGWD